MRRATTICAAAFGLYVAAAIVPVKSFALPVRASSWQPAHMVHTGLLWAGGHGDSDSRMNVRDEETIRHSFDLGSGSHEIEIDNVEGSIEVVGTDSNQVSLTVHKKLRAETQSRLDVARKEVTLDIKHEGGILRLFVDGPFRCNCGDGWGCGSGVRRCVNYRGNLGYRVQMDFTLQIPRNSDVRLSTVNSGEVRVREVRGAYSVRNVNGGIEMISVAGSGSAHTVNGPVKVTFRENPKTESSFKSINGDIDLYFARGLSADFRFKNFNGGIYSDFPVTSLPHRSIQSEREGRKTVFRADRFTGGRVGSGGVEIRTENLNGDIRIRENQ